MLLAVLAVVSVAGRDTLLQAAGDFLAVEDPIVQVDAVIAISGDGRERVRRASALVEQGVAGWLILSGGPSGLPGAADEMVRFAQGFGIADDRLLIDARATSTVENAVGSARLMRARGLRTAVLVTSPYHMRRAVIIFRRVFRSQGLSVRASPVRDSFFEVQRWWTRGRDRELVIREYAKLFAFLIGFR
jgi:uncharacterized SAM-binding protein YcdF (DUF218 family)